MWYGSSRSLSLCAAVGALLAMPAACSSSEGDDGSGAAGGGGSGQICAPSTVEECTCTDGASGSKICKADGSGHEACYCTADAASTGTGAGGAGDGGNGASGGNPQVGGSGPGGAGGTPIGYPPEVIINHPSDGETRQINTDIPFIGQAADVEDGMLPNAEWASDLEGPLGTGTNLTVQLTMVGTHVVSFRATDSDGNEDVASISLILVP